MASITSAQASFISSGRINDFGSNEDFTPRESQSALIKLAALLIETAQKNLNESGQVSSGALSDSFTATEPIQKGNSLHIEVSALDYYDYQNKGVRGTKGGASSGNYAFKNAFPSQAMVSAIQKWIEHGHAVTKRLLKKHAISKTESKNATLSDMDNAYMVARSIKIHGIKGTGYFDKSVKLAQAYAKDILGTALTVDIINSLPKKLNNGNSN
jgi:hypothetical protein